MINDGTASAWAAALLMDLRNLRTVVQYQFGLLDTRLNDLADQIAKVAEELEQDSATLDCITATTTATIRPVNDNAEAKVDYDRQRRAGQPPPQEPTMSSVTTTFEPGPGNTIRFFTHYEDSGTGMAGRSHEDVEPQADVFGIPWQRFIDAGSGIIDRPEDGPAVIRPVDDTAPAWASALLAAVNDLRAEMQKTDTRLDRIADQLNQTADEIEQANATLDRIIAGMTDHSSKAL